MRRWRLKNVCAGLRGAEWLTPSQASSPIPYPNGGLDLVSVEVT